MSILDGTSPYLYVLSCHLGNLQREEDFNAFYDQHTQDLCTVPGFNTGARYQERNKEGRYLAGYELQDLSVFTHPAYLQITGWGEWERELKHWRRAVYHVVKTFPESPAFPGIARA